MAETNNQLNNSSLPPRHRAEKIIKENNLKAEINGINAILASGKGNPEQNFFKLSEKEIKAITGDLQDFDQLKVDQVRSLQTKLYINYQYLLEISQNILEEDENLNEFAVKVEEKHKLIKTLENRIMKSQMNLDKDKAKFYKQKREALYRFNMINKNIKASEAAVAKAKDFVRKTQKDHDRIVKRENEIKAKEAALQKKEQAISRLEVETKKHDLILQRRLEQIQERERQVSEKEERIQSQLDYIAKFNEIHEKKKAQLELIMHKISSVYRNLETSEVQFQKAQIATQNVLSKRERFQKDIERLERRRDSLISEISRLNQKLLLAQEKFSASKSLITKELSHILSSEEPARRVEV